MSRGKISVILVSGIYWLFHSDCFSLGDNGKTGVNDDTGKSEWNEVGLTKVSVRSPYRPCEYVVQQTRSTWETDLVRRESIVKQVKEVQGVQKRI